jgi:DNA topoisomerase VI subunit B
MSSISSTTKAFSILGKLIYSNVDISVFTEVITNACDSHIIAKQTRPVEISMVGPNIHIRDYGTGITPEAIDMVYMKFFESTKEEDSSVCGKFGLGSKHWSVPCKFIC